MMALKALRLVLFLVWWDSAASSNAQFGQPSEYSTLHEVVVSDESCSKSPEAELKSIADHLGFLLVSSSSPSHALVTRENSPVSICYHHPFLCRGSAACRKTGPCYEDLDCVNRQEHSVQVEKGEESGMKIAKPWASEKHGYGSTS
ncbi:hypothetical protein MG293_007029 [Ovis ammon polii]|uniref:Uncharacterized protein n=1 Tax=Ovis ammon polii TaxID=230172 RepID=A0AAD4UB98_OVIAM|nr:hypothetical protein MG293_007029 [Ovis ammon polii]KAI4572364.1 hypothetical protein MJT46_005432 [Ovis ammon polii x Ovis aries]